NNQKRFLFVFFYFHFFVCILSELTAGIINGKKAPKESLPYMVSLQNKRRHVCGGFVISEDFVATSAFCDGSPTHVVLGSHNLKKGYDEGIMKTMIFIVLMLCLQLSSKVQTGSKVQRIPLPPAEIKLKDNQVCQVAGWGLTETGAPADELRVVDVPVINPQVCQNEWGSLLANVICAGGYGTKKGFCQGDGGDPLVCSGIAVVIVSFSKKSDCEQPDSPHVYTDISKHLQWINKILKQELEVFKFCVRKRLM
uniref:Peptidase S1 domain-containing protein n=1 Tax=Amphilophus citrinellus TaxID=61819 RepID=A0A3Q0RC00_AMPCI